MPKKINCPYCGSETIYGALEISGSALGFLFLGLSQQNLHFKPFDEKYQEFSTQKETVMTDSEDLHAMKCIKCNSISFIPKDLVCKPKKGCCGGGTTSNNGVTHI